MPLTNAQYDELQRVYEQRQNDARHQLNERIQTVYEQIPEYKEIEDQISSVSVAQSKKLLEGDEHALEDLKVILHELAHKKQTLLSKHNFPINYLKPMYQCPDCQDTGYINGRKCHCFRQEEITRLYAQSNNQTLLKTDNFSSLSYEYYAGDDLLRFQKAADACKKFVKNFKSDYHNLFFYGTVGTGKSFLSSCVAKELLDAGQLVLYFSSTQLFDVLSKSVFEKDSREAMDGIYDDIYSCDLLIIDDLGTELVNTFVNSQLFSCLNNRNLRKKSTIISTNLSLEELRDRYSDRIFSRITSNYDIFKLTGPDIRMQKRRARR